MAAWDGATYNREDTSILVTLDADDPSLAAYEALPLKAAIGMSASKIHAINRDVENAHWDILVVASDDLLVKTPKYDKYIREEFASKFPDLDGILWANDGFNSRICCHPCIGRKYYDRFGYVFHPSYKSLFADDELTLVARRAKKIKQTDKIKFVHQHPSARTRSMDALDRKNKIHFQEDKNNFIERGRLGFP